MHKNIHANTIHSQTHAHTHIHTQTHTHITRTHTQHTHTHTHTQENYPGEYINFTTFNSNVPFHSPPPEKDPNPPLVDMPPSFPPDLPDEPKARFVDVFVDFKLRNVTAEFPNVSCYH